MRRGNVMRMRGLIMRPMITPLLPEVGSPDPPAKPKVTPEVTQIVSTQAAHQQVLPQTETDRSTWSVSPGAVSRVSDYESENCFLRLKQQQDNVLSEIAATIGFARDNSKTPTLPGLSEEILGTTQEPPNVGLP
jgi:hypothetical protein